MTALFHLFDRLPIPTDSVHGDGISIWLFGALAGISALVTYASERFFSSRSTRRRAEIVVFYENRSCRLHALCDSGNLLREPISGKPCILVDPRAFHGILPDRFLRTCVDRAFASLEHAPPPLQSRLCLVPSHTAIGASMLIGFRPDRIGIQGEKNIRHVDALLVFSDLIQTADGANALLPPELLV